MKKFIYILFAAFFLFSLISGFLSYDENRKLSYDLKACIKVYDYETNRLDSLINLKNDTILILREELKVLKEKEDSE